MALNEILLTSFFTVVCGTAVFVIGNFIVKIHIEPLDNLLGTIARVYQSLIFYANVYSDPGAMRPAVIRSASHDLRELSSQIWICAYSVKKYEFFRKLGLIPPIGNLIKVHKELMGLSNSMSGPFDGEDNLRRRGKIEQLLLCKSNGKNNIAQATIYTIITIGLSVAGYFKDPLFYYGAIIIALVSFYWIWKEWKKK